MSDSPAAIPHIGSNLGQSVVPDLMKVYESLTQSSTPHAPGGAGGGVSTADSTDHHANTGRPGKQLPMSTSYEQQEQQQYAAYEPPVPDLAQAPPQPPSLAAAATTASPSASSKEKPSSSSAGRGVRSSTRKRGRDSQQSQGQATSASASSSGGRGGGSRSRKKTTKADGRWSKRFQWPDELHREFVSAVFDVGLKHASPSALMEFMDVTSNTGNNNHGASITSERVKSHLQKYRLHRARSKKEFLATYDAAMAKMRKRGSSASESDGAMGSQGYLVDRDEIAALASGEVAAHLTCVASATDDAATSTSAAPPGGKQLAASMVEATSSSSSSSSSANVLHLPQLTEEEKRSPIGASMGYLMGLFFALQQQLSHQRAAKQARQDLYQQQHEQQQQDRAAAAAPHSPLEAPPTNPAGPEYGSYVAPPPQLTSQLPPSHSPHLETPQQQQHRYHHHPSHHHHHHHQPFGSHHDGQQAIETSTSAILEENNMMKRDMRAQMRFQNQMRAFKDKEVAKVQQQPPVHPRQHHHHGHTTSSSHTHQHHLQDQHDAFAEAVKEQDSAFAAVAAGEASSGEAGHQEDPTATAAAIAAASASGTARARAASIGLSDADFWDSSLDDNELFDFLTGM